jgi:hypothetical protein
MIWKKSLLRSEWVLTRSVLPSAKFVEALNTRISFGFPLRLGHENREDWTCPAITKMPANLMGIDVGFSADRPTTGIACLEGDQLTLERAGTAWESREAKIPKGFHPSVIAIDGPLLPGGAPHDIRRHVESVFIRTPFHNRCRPGLSHHGVGLELRQASGNACTQFGSILTASVLLNGGTVCHEGPIVEAFPNAFLGVLMPEVELLAAPRFKRGRRFDWLYTQMVTSGRLKSLLSESLHLPDVVWHRLRTETDHELRAALICFLTAALADKGTASIIGETQGGWFWLPPWSLWEPWATRGLESAEKRMALKVTSVLDGPSAIGQDLISERVSKHRLVLTKGKLARLNTSPPTKPVTEF